MKTYSVLYAEDVPHYGHAEIEATDDDAAIEAARKLHAESSLDFYDAEWDNAICKRIVRIEDQNGEIIAESIPLDSYYLSHGEPQRLLCKAAADLFLALKRARDELQFQQKHYPRGDDTELREVLHAANVALAKAEGGAP